MLVSWQSVIAVDSTLCKSGERLLKAYLDLRLLVRECVVNLPVLVAFVLGESPEN